MAEAACYRWGDLAHDSPMEKLSRRRVIGAQAMIAHITLEQGCFVPMHNHANEQFSCVISGRLRFIVGSAADGAKRGGARDTQAGAGGQREFTLGPSEVLHLPANVPHSAEALEKTIVLDIFSPPSATTGIDHKAQRAH